MKITRLLLVLAAFATGTFAQETPAPADPAKLALAREVIAAMKADRMFDNMAKQMRQMVSQMPMPSTGMTPEQAKKSQELQDKMMDLSMNTAKGMIAKMDQIYADVYSDAELRAMKAFFAAPEGQSMLAKQPQIMARVMPLVQEMQRNLMPQIQKLIEESKATATPPAGK